MRHRSGKGLQAFGFLVMALLLTLVAACSSAEAPQVASLDEGPSEPTASSEAGNVDDGGLAFAQCMRENGIDFPDPDPDGGFGPNSSALADLDFNDPKFLRAVDACAALRPQGSPLDQQFDEAQQEAVLKLTKCMRKNGIDIPDPQFDANGKIIIGDLLRSVNPADPNFAKAIQECRELLPTDMLGQ